MANEEKKNKKVVIRTQKVYGAPKVPKYEQSESGILSAKEKVIVSELIEASYFPGGWPSSFVSSNR